jgi:uncharacterized protein (TIGR02678 family)
MTAVPSEHELQQRVERVHAFRELLRRPLMSARIPEYALVRRHHDVLKREFADLLGYELVLRSDHARLRKQPLSADPTRPMRIVPGGREKVSRDRWQPFTRRHYALLCLCLAALERSGPQTTIDLLATDVRELAREESIPLDFQDRDHRRALAQAVDALVELDVLTLIDGDAERWVRNDDRGEISLYDVSHGMLSDLLVTRHAAHATTPQEFVDAADDYAPTEDGRNSRLRHRVARRLVEEPVLYLEELPADERAYYASSQRPHLDRRVAEATGLHAERRSEGTAMVDAATQSRQLTDLRFPADVSDRQAALLLCETIGRAYDEEEPPLTRAQLRAQTRALLERYARHWGRDTDGESVALLLEEALSVLIRMKLVRVEHDRVIALPALARFRAPQIQDPRHGAQAAP